MFFDDEKRYVTREEGLEMFPDGVAVWAYCANCEAPLLLRPNDAPLCNGHDTSACEARPSAN